MYKFIENIEKLMTARINNNTKAKPFWDKVNFCSKLLQFLKNNNEEFDPGSGWTLAAGFIHASRGVTGSACTPLTTGERVRNAYATYLLQGDSQKKFWIISHMIILLHGIMMKTSVVIDGHASY